MALRRSLLTLLALVATSVLAKPANTPWSKPNRKDLEKKLTPLQCSVTQDGATERPFHNEYWDNKRPGIYVDVVSGEPLFSSLDKYDSGSGWPSFTRPLAPGNVIRRKDLSGGMERVEIRSSKADSHLGHVFDDGPAPAGERYCINSAALKFIPLDRLSAEGYGEYRKLFMSEDSNLAAKKPTSEVSLIPSTVKLPPGDFAASVKEGQQVATVAGGCFWGMQEIIRKIPGVIKSQVGYTGGQTSNPGYREVSSGKTGHAESVQILFDPAKLSYEKLLGFYFRMHDPTTLNQQGNDKGTQYRSEIFAYTNSQMSSAKNLIERINKSGKWQRPVVTKIAIAGPFWRAEEEHQDYLQKNPKGYTCHYLRDE